METNKEEIIERLLEKKFISEEQFKEIKSYQSLGIFSLRNELLFLLYLSVLLFTSGVGTLIYKNIGSIGHTVILASIFILTLVCFYFSFKKSIGFSKETTEFENPAYDYLVLLGTILSCTFVGYLQFQYNVLGSDFGIASLVCALASFSSAYYFDNKSALSIAITALGAAIGITITPKALLLGDTLSNTTLIYSGIVLGGLLVVWIGYSNKINLKRHFDLVFLTFALNLIAVCCISGLFKDYWFVFSILLSATGYYFYKKSHEIRSVALFVFTLIYAYIGLNVSLGRILSAIDLFIFNFLVGILPFYAIGSILLFVKLIKQFNKSAYDSIR